MAIFTRMLGLVLLQGLQFTFVRFFLKIIFCDKLLTLPYFTVPTYLHTWR